MKVLKRITYDPSKLQPYYAVETSTTFQVKPGKIVRFLYKIFGLTYNGLYKAAVLAENERRRLGADWFEIDNKINGPHKLEDLYLDKEILFAKITVRYFNNP